MSSKAISEVSGKRLLDRHMGNNTAMAPCICASYGEASEWPRVVEANTWLKQKSQKLVAKVDQLIKRRGKLGLVCVGEELPGVQKWIADRAGKECQVGATTGRVHNFIVEPFVPHQQSEEMYICIASGRGGDTILFHPAGGVDIGDVDEVAVSYTVPTGCKIDNTLTEKCLLQGVSADKRKLLIPFIEELYRVYVDLHFTYLEINPLVVTTKIYVLDLAAKLDQTADFACAKLWEGAEFPTPFGRDAFAEERYIAELDAKSGASLKLTVLNKSGRVWTMVAGGGASVVYTDTLCDLGGAAELANYGEYSGAPTESQTAAYAQTIFELMCTGDPHPLGKVLIIGGGIANFTNVADTFRGIIAAIEVFKDRLRQHCVTIFVRRGGPNYQEGLRQMREIGQKLGIPLYVFGPEAHMTHICRLALGHEPVPEEMRQKNAPKTLPKLNPPPTKMETDDISGGKPMTKKELDAICSRDGNRPLSNGEVLFTQDTKSIVWGMQNRAIQNMLDFDYVCSRKEPSVVAVVYPFTTDHNQKFYFGNREIFVPVYSDLDVGFRNHPEASVLINFASLRSAFDSTLQAMEHKTLKTVVIIAEGIPENMTRKLIKAADAKKVTIIGPATVGGIKPGCFKIGNTAGMIDNILESKLYRPGSVAYVSKSGGMSNELNNIISKETDGVYEGVAIGGDRYPASTFLDHLIRYEKDPNVKMMVLLGEVGGVEEYHVCRAMLEGKIKKPLVAWCIGTCSAMFTSEVQFGHAGSCAGSKLEEAGAKNMMLARHGAYVPDSFDVLGAEVGAVYRKLVESGVLKPKPEVVPPKLPMDYDWAMKLGLIRKPAAFISTICDERGKELCYSGVPISKLVEREYGIGLSLSLLWFQRELPPNLCRFLEMCLIITADHGPAVSGAHNTIVCARAGKDLISSVVSGLLTIGDRFGGALDKAAVDFSAAQASGKHPMEFVNEKRAKGELIMGIGHRVKSINNPDERVSSLKRYVMSSFEKHPTLDYALDVEAITTRKKPNLILNVDGLIAAAFVDLFRHSGQFSEEEAEQYVNMGSINALFVLGRTIGLVGHYLDQNRLQQPLYRHPWDDITYMPKK